MDENILKQYRQALPLYRKAKKLYVSGLRVYQQPTEYLNLWSEIYRILGGPWSTKYKRYTFTLGEQVKFEKWAQDQLVNAD